MVRVISAAVVMALAVGLAGCSSAPEVPVPESLRSNLLALASQPTELELARRIVVRDCMTAAGFDVPFDSSPPPENGGTLIGVDGLFSSEEAARTAGYRTTRTEAVGPIESYEASLSATEAPKYRVAYLGRNDAKTEELKLASGTIVALSTEGCVAEAYVAVYGSIQNALKAQNFVNEVYSQSASYISDTSSALGPLLATYESCMSDAGYKVTGLGAAKVAEAELGKYRSVAEAPNKQEQDLAVNDYRCQEKTGLSAAVNDLFLTKSSAWIVQNEGLIVGTREIVDEAKARAQTIIDAS